MRFELIPPPPISVAVTDKTLGGGEWSLTLKSLQDLAVYVSLGAPGIN
jgi:hypothetical protein